MKPQRLSDLTAKPITLNRLAARLVLLAEEVEELRGIVEAMEAWRISIARKLASKR